ncbi:MAG TPA: ankyrin repeat domain-containing protein [Steroidobacteraceae bacterium]|nr:ankyrin repeat domain-containing protein [Steroidobacteraceae bacterium]
MRFVAAAFCSLTLFAGMARGQSAPNPAANDQLALAIAKDSAAAAQAALDAGADINANLGEGRTPLITAVMMVKPEAVKFLLEHGADPNRTADDGAVGNALSAAFFAMSGVAITRRGDEDYVNERRAKALESLRLVAARKPDFDVLVSRGPTRLSPLMIAADAGVADAVKILLDAGASPNFVNGGRYSALDYAVDRAPGWSPTPAAERLEVVKLLLAAGAQTKKVGADKLSPLERARKAANTEAVALLSK